MSPRKSNNPQQSGTPIRSVAGHRKPKADLYTLLLAMSLVAILIGILFLCLFMGGYYDWRMEPGPTAANISRATAATSLCRLTA